jgi:hypothetical protein
MGGAVGELGDAISAEGFYWSFTDDLMTVLKGRVDEAQVLFE